MTLSLHQKQVVFARLLPRLIDEALSLGFDVRLGEAWRTPEQAAWNAAHGKGISKSLHISRLAIDLILDRDGVYLTKSEDYAPLGVWWEQQSTGEYTCAWGGRFSKPDGNHFSIAHEGRR